MKVNKSVPINLWGKDHFSLLGYVECRCVDNEGELDRRHMRCNIGTHPILAGSIYRDPGLMKWNPDYGTRLKGYFLKNGKTDPSKKLDSHDDWDCLNDLEDAGLIEIISMVNGFVRMTPFGLEVAAKLREHKAKGGMFATFSL